MLILSHRTQVVTDSIVQAVTQTRFVPRSKITEVGSMKAAGKIMNGDHDLVQVCI